MGEVIRGSVCGALSALAVSVVAPEDISVWALVFAFVLLLAAYLVASVRP